VGIQKNKPWLGAAGASALCANRWFFLFHVDGKKTIRLKLDVALDVKDHPERGFPQESEDFGHVATQHPGTAVSRFQVDKYLVAHHSKWVIFPFI